MQDTATSTPLRNTFGALWQRPQTRLCLLLLLLYLGVALAGYAHWVEPFWLDVTQRDQEPGPTDCPLKL